MDTDKPPLKNPHSKWGFFFIDLAFPLHDSLISIRYLYPYQAMLPVRKIEMKSFHK